MAGCARSDAEDLDRYDRDCLVAENALVGLDLAGDVGVLNHCGSPRFWIPVAADGASARSSASSSGFKIVAGAA